MTSPYPGALAVTLAATCLVCALWVLGDYAWRYLRWYKAKQDAMRRLDAETDAIIKRGIRHPIVAHYLGPDLRVYRAEMPDTLLPMPLMDGVYYDTEGENLEMVDGRLVKKVVCP